MNILILDDDQLFMKTLQNDFINYFHNLPNLEFELKDNQFLDINANKIDIAFIDIDLIDYNGIDIALELRKKYSNLIIIFVSSREELVFQTFTVGVFQFIRKANYKEDIQIIFKQLSNYIHKHFDKKIIEIQGRKIVLEIDKIKYILSIGHDLIIKENNNEYTIKSSISDILKFFNSKTLVQIQRNLIINLSFIKEVRKTYIITNDNQEYKIGRIYQKDFINSYEEYLLT